MDHANTEGEKSFYLTLLERFERLGNGAKADIKRVSDPKELLSVGAFFRLCEQENDLNQYARVVFILPWLGHQQGKTLGALFYGERERGVAEARMIQMQRAEYPQDIIALRRLVWQMSGRHAEKSVDWDVVGPQLFYWGDKSKQKILQDYYIAEIKTKMTEEE